MQNIAWKSHSFFKTYVAARSGKITKENTERTFIEIRPR